MPRQKAKKWLGNWEATILANKFKFDVSHMTEFYLHFTSHHKHTGGEGFPICLESRDVFSDIFWSEWMGLIQLKCSGLWDEISCQTAKQGLKLAQVWAAMWCQSRGRNFFPWCWQARPERPWHQDTSSELPTLTLQHHYNIYARD